MKHLTVQLAAVTVLGFVVQANAELIVQDGLVHDSILNVTWLQDANYAHSELHAARINEIISAVGSVQGHVLTMSDFSLNGKMTWWGAMAWADQLVYGGYDDWRLPRTLPINGSHYENNWNYDGSTDVGYNTSAPGTAYQGNPGSEMAHLYYNTLGNVAYQDIDGNWPQAGWGLQNPGPFINIQATAASQDIYWSSTECGYVQDGAWHFRFYSGHQDGGSPTIMAYAWAVRGVESPNHAPVPEPSSLAMFLGLAGMGLVAAYRRRKRTT